MKRFGYLFLLIAFCALVGKGWHIAKDGFSINRTIYPMDFGSSEVSDPRIDEALAQSYSYLGRGHQCYAFGSEDGKYVVKLPRYDRYGLSFFLRSCRFPFLDGYRERIRADLKHRIEFIHESFRIASEELAEETGMIYLHLKRTDRWKKPLLLKDRLGRTYRLNPDKTAFILQEKKPIMMASFQECLKKGDRKGAQEILDSFLDLIAARARKGIFNKDPSFMRNFGWANGKGVQIDIGSFYRKPGVESPDESFTQTLGPVEDWLAKLDPQIYKHFEEKVQAIRETW